MSEADNSRRLISIALDAASIGRAPPDIEHERAVAIYDLIEENSFALNGHAGPYRLVLSVAEQRLVFDLRSEQDEPLVAYALSLTPFRKVVKDYFLVCESYHQAIRSGSPRRIEAIDMGRRGLHNEGSEILRERLKGKVELDFDTARRLFTLVCVLHWRG
jgi:uncharacterized protein (UPF0262 family)